MWNGVMRVGSGSSSSWSRLKLSQLHCQAEDGPSKQAAVELEHFRSTRLTDLKHCREQVQNRQPRTIQ